MNVGLERKGGDGWYDLFSRGARDWLRHNEKVREAVRENLPELISEATIGSGNGNRTVRVPVRFLEHFRFRLSDAESSHGVGQGAAKPGDVLANDRGQGQGGSKGAGGNEEGAVQFVLELKVDDIVDWLWEELKLPNLQARAGAVEQDDYRREGWDRRGARSRLDRRRSLKESLKRRSVQPDGPTFSNEDLRFRQLVQRERPATQAVVFFAMDVSSSMSEHDRKLAKTFFFWVIQGLRRQYTHIEPVFVAHTIEAWEFSEDEFFQVKGQGGTVSSSAFVKVNEIIKSRYNPAHFNVYLFYASDGDNFPEDRSNARDTLKIISEIASYVGYVETAGGQGRGLQTETAEIFRSLVGGEERVGSFALSEQEDVFEAIRRFFKGQVAQAK